MNLLAFDLLTLQLIFYVVAIFSGLIGIITLSLAWLSRGQENRHKRRTYSPEEKKDYYLSRKHNMKLSFSDRAYAEKQLKKLR